MKYNKLFEQVKIGKLEIPNRYVMAPVHLVSVTAKVDGIRGE